MQSLMGLSLSLSQALSRTQQKPLYNTSIKIFISLLSTLFFVESCIDTFKEMYIVHKIYIKGDIKETILNPGVQNVHLLK